LDHFSKGMLNMNLYVNKIMYNQLEYKLKG